MIRIRRLLAATALLGLAAAPALADCNSLMAGFDQAVAARNIDAVRKAVGDIGASLTCKDRRGEFQDKAFTFMIALAAAPASSEDLRRKALDTLEETMPGNGTWKNASDLADYYAARKQRPQALKWFDNAVTFMATRLSSKPTDEQKKNLAQRAALTKALASDDKGGTVSVAYAATQRDNVDGSIGGIYSPQLRGAEPLPIPLPIQFFTGETRLTPNGEKAIGELAQAAKEQNIPHLKLIGHADPRGTPQYNLELSRRRVEAVRGFLLNFMKGQQIAIDIDWKGSQQPIDASVLGYPISQDEVWALDRRVECVLDAAN